LNCFTLFYRGAKHRFVGMFSLLLCGLMAPQVMAQRSTDTLKVRELEAVVVAAPRLATSSLRAPFSVSVVNKTRLQQGQQQLTLNEALAAVPGLLATNADNFSQGLRISIRGFGARSAFGIRGIKILQDGIPESTPDGQGQTNNIDLNAVERLEVIRGPAAVFYGNASGGVVSLSTETLRHKPYAELRSSIGNYGFGQVQVKTGFGVGKWTAFWGASHNRATGYRAQSGTRITTANAKLRYQFDSTAHLTLLFNYANSPQADDPGALTLAQTEQDRRQARLQNVQFAAGKTIAQRRVGLVFEKQFGAMHQLTARAYQINRDFENNLAFENGGNVTFERVFRGTNLTYALNLTKNQVAYKMQAGIDYENQTDDRQRYNNLRGTRGNLTLNQLEQFKSLGVAWLHNLSLGKHLFLTAGLRYDQMKLATTDRFLTDGDQSGALTFDNLAPMAGMLYSLNDGLHLYANYSTNFESPALTELTNNPTGQGGFNSLQPQRARNIEVGVKGLLSSKLRYELAIFDINVTNELVPYQLAAFPGRVFFRNAGESRRQGVELGLEYYLSKHFSAFATYTYSDFKYSSYQTTEGTFNGNQLPGIPRQAAYVELRYNAPFKLFAVAQLRHNDALFADDANRFTANAHNLLNLRLGWAAALKSIIVEPFVGVNNLTDVQYMGNVQINGAGARYFEPATGRFWFAGVRIRVGE
jgi:iron complex outermembrane recepter protein